MPNPIIAIVFQDVPATPVTAQTLLLLTSTPKYDRTTTPAISEPQQSSASHSQHTEKLPYGDPSSVEVFQNAAEAQMDLLLANQHSIMANQAELQAHQQRLDRRMDKMENLLLQILNMIQKVKGNQ